MCGEIPYSFPIFKGAAVEICGMNKWLHPTLYWVCDYLSMLGLKLIYVDKRGPRGLVNPQKSGHRWVNVPSNSVWMQLGIHAQIPMQLELIYVGKGGSCWHDMLRPREDRTYGRCLVMYGLSFRKKHTFSFLPLRIFAVNIMSKDITILRTLI